MSRIFYVRVMRLPITRNCSKAKLVLLRVPDAVLPRVIEELCASELVFPELSFVLCESWILTDALKPLEGARRFGGEPGSGARRQAKKLRGGGRTHHGPASPASSGTRGRAHSGTSAQAPNRSIFAADLFASALPVPLLLTAQQALRDSGVTGNHLWDSWTRWDEKCWIRF